MQMWSPPARERDRLGTGGAVSEEVFWAVRKLVETLARSQPLVLVFEDVHWAEPTLLDLIEHLADWVRNAAVLIVCLARPELLDGRPAWGGGKLNASSILLEPLTPRESAQLLADLSTGDCGCAWGSRAHRRRPRRATRSSSSRCSPCSPRG